ncbi:MAG: cytochrome c oxidase assembly protein [Rickettsiales bacterium]|nr:cytochrome c oxidase assembly protein [Rickettsiales bacterium]
MTGYSGTASSSGAVTIGTRLYDVQFNAEDSNSKKISFSTKTKTIETLSGKNNLVIFELTNKSDEDVTLTALYNVLPQKAAQYFVKIECFCYEELTFKANSTSKLPVSFYLDPEIEKDPFLKNIDKITLSYSVHIDN